MKVGGNKMRTEKAKIIDVLTEVRKSEDENRFELCVDNLVSLKNDSIKNGKLEDFNRAFTDDKEVDILFTKKINNKELQTIISSIVFKRKGVKNGIL